MARRWPRYKYAVAIVVMVWSFYEFELVELAFGRREKPPCHRVHLPPSLSSLVRLRDGGRES